MEAWIEASISGGMIMLRIKETQLKSVKRATMFPDTYFVSKFGVSPYRGCQHACAYCDGRSEKYFVEGVFDEDIEVRLNTAQILDSTLTKSREWGIVGVSSGVSDAYQPIEKKYKIMPDVLDVLIKHRSPAYIMTKSDLPLRDLVKWKRLNEVAGATLFVSLTTVDDEIGHRFEPRAPLPSKRLEMIRQFKEAGIGVVALAMPFMPKITDMPELIDELLSKLKELDVDAIMPGGMTLRPGCQKKWFMDQLEEYNPELVSFYEKLYRENKQSGAPLNSYTVAQAKYLSSQLRKYDFLEILPHHLYQGRLQIYDELWVLLTHMLKIYSRRGVDVTKLSASRKKYGAWLEVQKKSFNRNRTLTGNDLDSQFGFMIQTGEFHKLIENDKLADFLISVVVERKQLNYRSLKLE